ncbi:MAG: nickel pincer cofactor biosynthesis protein LarC [Coriobacteriia bacterium]|nr:nickel pincer cofactor biosynthesis protein LarC [Coriobacteriia bacterium]MBN2822388.1 nickel pincer cofactor biosynthesis protein LarC [Coriobacteriia bacterium]
MIAYLDCATGASGDKLLSALIDAGFRIEDLREALSGLGLGHVRVETAEVSRAGVRGLHLTVEAPDDRTHRHWKDIRELIESSSLPAPVREDALATFELIAHAEAKVHGTTPEQVHFHEVGAIDSIVDVVGVALGIHSLGIKRLISSVVAVGSGTVNTAHGVLPVPAPATALLLEGVPIVGTDLEGELTTPTGAALVRIHADGFGPMSAMTLRAVGHGAGTRELARPNVARLLLGEPITRTIEPDTEEIVVLESTIDHLSGEHLAYAADQLRETAALDVWMTPVVMKKGRPAVVLSVLARPSDAGDIAQAVLAQTGTLGVRVMPADRLVAPRRQLTLQTSMGSVRFKVSDTPGATPRIRAEAEDCMRLAHEHGMPVARVAQMLAREAEQITGL